MNPSSILNSILAMFAEPTFESGTRVNRLVMGSLDRTDGRVVAQTEKGVLVEWPRKGAHWERPQHLCQQLS